jgi:polyhydroxyalkanoate synthase
MRAMDGFIAAMPAYPGKLFDEMWYRLVLANDLNRGCLQLPNRRVDLGCAEVPVLAIAGTSDPIAPVPAAQALTRVLTGAPSVRFETAPGGHLGVVTGTSARTTTWNMIDDYLAEFSKNQP